MERNQVQAGWQTLQEHTQAISQVAAIVQPTFGPKGLDVMLVNEENEPAMTRAGAKILSSMAIDHPVGKLLARAATTQWKQVGDGTTTTVLLANAMVEEGCRQVLRGIPVVKVQAGIEKGVVFALKKYQEEAYGLSGVNDQWLQHIAMTASHQYEDIALAAVDAAQIVEEPRLASDYRLAESIVSHARAENIVFAGILIQRQRDHVQMPTIQENARLLVIEGDFLPTTETLKQFKSQLLREINVLLVEGELHPDVEELCIKQGILAVSQIDRATLHLVARHTDAQVVRGTQLPKSEEQRRNILGFCEEVEEDQLLHWVRIGGGAGRPEATILLGGSSDTALQEREQIACEATSAVQAAVRGGFVAGGGSVELAIARELERYAESVAGLERYGVLTVAEALYRPMSQLIANAGFQAWEKVEIIKRMQRNKSASSIGIDCDRGHAIDMLEMGVVDPLPIKLNALRTAKEVAVAILRIHSSVRTAD